MRPGGWVDDRWRHRAAQVTRAEDLRGAVTGFDPDEDFYEDDEPLEDVLAAFERGEKLVTARPPGRTLTVVYRPLGGAWWEAVSPQLAHLGKGADLAQLQEDVRTRLAEWLDPEVTVVEQVEG